MRSADGFSDRLVAACEPPSDVGPLLTIAIPHYKHRRYLEIVLQSIFEQQFDDFEIVVSDDCSPDDSREVLPQFLQQSGRAFRYYCQSSNLGYDGNVRFCLAAAKGRYVFLLGNDDALGGPATLREIAAALQQLAYPKTAFTDYSDWATGIPARRAQGTGILGAGPDTAVQHFRTFSFVSGLIFDRALAERYDTDRWDCSIYYQIYLGSRIVASGGRLAAIGTCGVRKDVRVDGETVPNHATKWANAPRSFQIRPTGLESVIRVTADGILPMVPEERRSNALRRIISQVLSITYPYWLFEYRRLAGWSFAVGIARGLWPGKLLSEYHLRLTDRLYLWMLYLVVTLAGLIIPARWFNANRYRLAAWLHSSRQRVLTKTSPKRDDVKSYR